MSNILILGSASGAGVVTLKPPTAATSITITLPNDDTTLVGFDTTQTLTNKTIANPILTGQVIVPEGTAAVPGIAFANDGSPDTGFYHIADGSFGVSCNTVPMTRFSSSSGTTMLQQLVTAAANGIQIKPNDTSTAYGVIHRNDGSNYYVLLTALNDSGGGYNGLRPLTINCASGDITFQKPFGPTATLGTDSTQLATTAFVQDTVAAVVKPTASATVVGMVELATNAEAIAGTDTTRAVTPAGLAAAFTGSLHFYTGTTDTNLVFPIGSYVAVAVNQPTTTRNNSQLVYLWNGAPAFGFTAYGTPLTGTWCLRGYAANTVALMQRTA